eukprot:TRINITY_DN1715_c0_g1_i1.p1 TRINITY_DN1715_c0_g1~~TRINITY_DN1715_c0_g1_i1.p1  ORF type:complete len:617 (+),score=142.60 TRINITY_DN1715_c0_g1_i1:98-1948(+)
MAKSAKSLLVGEILREQFGPVVQAVAQCLMERGRASIDEIVRSLNQRSTADSEWTAVSTAPGTQKKTADRSLRRAVSDAVLTGVQHNFIGIFKELKKPGDGKLLSYLTNNEMKETNIYYLDSSRVLMRLRFSKILLVTKNRFGVSGEAVVDEILTEGRLNLPTLVNAVKNRTGMSSDEITNVFSALMRSGFIVQATNEYYTPPAENDDEKQKKHEELEPDRIDQPKSQKSGSKQAAKLVSQPAPPPASQSDTTPELALYMTQTTAKPSTKQPAKATKAASKVPAKSKKRQHDGEDGSPPPKRSKKGELMESSVSVTFDPHTVWCVNYYRYLRAWLEVFAAQFVTDKFDARSGTLLQQMFLAVEPASYGSLKEVPGGDNYAAMTMKTDNSFENIVSSDRVVAIGTELGLRDQASAYADILARHPAKLLVLNQAPPGYRINMPVLLTLCRRRLVESVIAQRFGQQAVRIFRLIAEKRITELKQISECAMVPSTDAKVIAFNLFQAGFIHEQPVIKGPGGQDAGKPIFLFSVVWAQAEDTVIQHLYGSIRKLRARLAHTYQTFQHLHRKAEEADRLQTHLMTDSENQMLDHARNMENRIYASILRLDDHLLLLTSSSFC